LPGLQLREPAAGGVCFLATAGTRCGERECSRVAMVPVLCCRLLLACCGVCRGCAGKNKPVIKKAMVELDGESPHSHSLILSLPHTLTPSHSHSLTLSHPSHSHSLTLSLLTLSLPHTLTPSHTHSPHTVPHTLTLLIYSLHHTPAPSVPRTPTPCALTHPDHRMGWAPTTDSDKRGTDLL